MLDEDTRKRLSEKINDLVGHITEHRNTPSSDDYAIAQDFNSPEITAESSDVKTGPRAVREYLKAHLDYLKSRKLDPYNSPRKVLFDSQLRPLMADIDDGWFGKREFYPALGEGDRRELLERAKNLAYISIRNYSAYKD